MQSLAQPGPTPGRDETLARLARERFDVLVIGGGIVGAGTAALAARHGLRVALLERADFASGSSSASSKLIHGGLRYLRMGDFRLVREALHERRVLKQTVAPQLVRDLDFVLPVYHGGPYGRGPIGAALALYSLLGGHARGRGRFVPAARAQALVPALRGDGLRGVGLYADAETNDARLCLANVRATSDVGAAVANRVEVVGIERAGGETRIAARDLCTGAALEVAARSVVNASGAAVDSVRRLEDPHARTSVSLSKGAHLVLERPPGWRAALTIPIDRERVSFAIPWEGLLLLGTTDSAFDPERDTLAVTAGEETQILAEAGRVLPPEVLRSDAIRARFAGLRVLPRTGGATAEARREVVLTRGPLGVVSVAGGKLTTYRAIALSVLSELSADLGLRAVDREPFPLPGATDPELAATDLRRDFPALEPEQARHLARTYGSLASEVLASGSLEPLAPGALDVEAQAVYALEREWALDADDLLRRRTTLALRGLDTPELRERLARLAGERIRA